MSEELEVVEVAEVVEVETPEDVSVQSFPNGWHLVTAGDWQVSISEDGLIRLPFGVMPETVGDLVEALKVAGEVGAAVRANNQARAAAAAAAAVGRPQLLSRGGVVVQAGPPPEGAIRLPVVPRVRKG